MYTRYSLEEFLYSVIFFWTFEIPLGRLLTVLLNIPTRIIKNATLQSSVCCFPSREEQYLRLLMPLFYHDVLLPRTLTAILGYKSLLRSDSAPMIPVEAYMANLFFLIKVKELPFEDEKVS